MHCIQIRIQLDREPDFLGNGVIGGSLTSLNKICVAPLSKYFQMLYQGNSGLQLGPAKLPHQSTFSCALTSKYLKLYTSKYGFEAQAFHIPAQYQSR